MNWMGLHVTCEDSLRELLIAELSQLTFTTFEETASGFSAYCEMPDWNESVVVEVLKKYDVSSFNCSEVEWVNWNDEWEKNYDPIIVKDQLIVRAPFHPESDLPLEIVILPKMSFGTGHHATTYLMLEYQLELDQCDKKVLDVGSGTGVLSIMARKMGANDVVAIDIGDWCVENSRENFILNNCQDIRAEQMEIYEIQQGTFDVILANITKGVHSELMPEYHRRLNQGGFLLLSGFFTEDVKEVQSLTQQCGFQFVETKSHNGWARLVCRKL